MRKRTTRKGEHEEVTRTTTDATAAIKIQGEAVE